MKKYYLLLIILLNVWVLSANPIKQFSDPEKKVLEKTIVEAVFNQLSIQSGINFEVLTNPAKYPKAARMQQLRMQTDHKNLNLSEELLTFRPEKTVVELPPSITGSLPIQISKLELRYSDYVTITELLPINESLGGVQIPTTIKIGAEGNPSVLGTIKITTKQGPNLQELLSVECNLSIPLIGVNEKLFTAKLGIITKNDIIDYTFVRIEIGNYIKGMITTLPNYDYEINLYTETNCQRIIVCSYKNAVKKKLQETDRYLTPTAEGYSQSDLIMFDQSETILYRERTWSLETPIDELTIQTDGKIYRFEGKQTTDSIYQLTDRLILNTQYMANSEIAQLLNIAQSSNTDQEIINYEYYTILPEQEPVLIQRGISKMYNKEGEGYRLVDLQTDEYKQGNPNPISRSKVELKLPINEQELSQIITSSFDMIKNKWEENTCTYAETNVNSLLFANIENMNSTKYPQIIYLPNGDIKIITPDSEVHYTIYTKMGEKVLSNDLPSNMNIISTNSLNKGVYLLHINKFNESFVHKIFIAK